jgi:hypothetical protein
MDGATELQRPVPQCVEGATLVGLRPLNEPQLGLFEQSSCRFHPWVDSNGTRRLIGCDHDASGPDAIGDREFFERPRPQLYRQVREAKTQPQHETASHRYRD